MIATTAFLPSRNHQLRQKFRRARLHCVTDLKGLNTQYPRDGLGQASQLTSLDTGTASLTYGAGGNLLTRTDSWGVLAQYSDDATNRITGYTRYAAPSGATTGSRAPAQDQRFAYDSVDRLTQGPLPHKVAAPPLMPMTTRGITTLTRRDALGRPLEVNPVNPGSQ